MVRPRAENYEERRQEILDAAASMFAAKGFDGTSMSAIAMRCGVSKALLYHYYQSKEELLYSMLLSHCNLLVATATTALDGSSFPNGIMPAPEIKLKALIRSLMQLYMESRDKHIVLLNNLHALPAEQQSEIKQLEKSLVGIIKGILTELRPNDTESVRTALSMYLMGAINWTYTWFKPDGPISSEKYADIATATFLNGVIGKVGWVDA